MSISIKSSTRKPVHPWIRKISLCYHPGPTTSLLEQVADDLLAHFQRMGHTLNAAPDDSTDVILTTAPFGRPVPWREALLFTARRRFGLKHSPTIFTLIHVRPDELDRYLDHFAQALEKDPPDPQDYEFPGLAPDAYRVLYEQGRRGGPILALERLVQAQSKSIRVLLLTGDETPEMMYHFDLVGAHPASNAGDLEAFYEDIALRMVTGVSTREITEHKVVGEPLSREVWENLHTPRAMRTAGQKLGLRDFFTEMVRIADLVNVPALADAVSSQYSEGCFATWDPEIEGLITTVTGSARPVDKGSITEDDLAVIVGVRPDGKGALVRHVEGKRNDPPSSEAVEMMDMDSTLPHVSLPPEWGISGQVPIIRSKLHGHRGVSSYSPKYVEHVPLDPPYYHYPVSCATEAQATGIKQAFARSQALQNPEDPRQVVFTILPGHGVVIAEKWVKDKEPFQVMWEFMDAGYLNVANHIPQGEVRYELGPDGDMHLQS